MIHIQTFSEQSASQATERANEWLKEVSEGIITAINRKEFRVINVTSGNFGRDIIITFEGWQI